MGLDYYAILDLPRTASIFDIKLAYRKLALRLHPQRKDYPQHPNERPEGVFDLPLPTLSEKTYWEVLNEAYDVLSNALRREVYDQYGDESLKRGVAAPHGFIAPYYYHGDHMKTYFEFFGSYSPYCDLIDAATNPPNLYNTEKGCGVKHKDPTIERKISIDLAEVFFGGVKIVKILRNEFVDDFKLKTEVKEVSVSVPIAPGILEGTRLVFPELGDQGPTRIPADIDFIVCIEPHEIFSRDKNDLHMEKCISLKEALTGFKLTVDTIDDRKLEFLITSVVGYFP